MEKNNGATLQEKIINKVGKKAVVELKEFEDSNKRLADIQMKKKTLLDREVLLQTELNQPKDLSNVELVIKSRRDKQIEVLEIKEVIKELDGLLSQAEEEVVLAAKRIEEIIFSVVSEFNKELQEDVDKSLSEINSKIDSLEDSSNKAASHFLGNKKTDFISIWNHINFTKISLNLWQAVKGVTG